MGLFRRGKGKVPLVEERLAHLEDQLGRIASELRLLQTEQIRLHADARRWMQRARAAERRASGAVNGVVPGPGATFSPGVPPPRPTSSARGRMSPLTLARLGINDRIEALSQTTFPRIPQVESPSSEDTDEGDATRASDGLSNGGE